MNWIATQFKRTWSTVALQLAARVGRLRHRRSYKMENRQAPARRISVSAALASLNNEALRMH